MPLAPTPTRSPCVLDNLYPYSWQHDTHTHPSRPREAMNEEEGKKSNIWRVPKTNELPTGAFPRPSVCHIETAAIADDDGQRRTTT